MKKLAIVALLVMAGCRRQATVTSAPAPVGGTGGATAREALQLFMASAKAQDLQAMSNIWGTSAGPARGRMPQEDLEMREVVMMRCLRHDVYAVKAEMAAPASERVFSVEVRRGYLAPVSDFTATLGPAGRWYIRNFDLKSLDPICLSR